HEAIYLAIQPIGQLNLAEVNILILDERHAPYPIRELPELPSPERSLMGLAATDGLVAVSGDTMTEPLPITRWHGNFTPNPDSDCVVCAPNYRDRDPIDIYVIRHHGSIDFTNRTPEFNRRAGRFVARVIHPYVRLKDTLVLREQNGRVSVLYQYSQMVIRELTWPEPLDGGYFWPDRLVDANDDGYPEVVGTEVCHCYLGTSYFAVMDLQHGEVVYVEYTGGPSWDP